MKPLKRAAAVFALLATATTLLSACLVHMSKEALQAQDAEQTYLDEINWTSAARAYRFGVAHDAWAAILQANPHDALAASVLCQLASVESFLKSNEEIPTRSPTELLDGCSLVKAGPAAATAVTPAALAATSAASPPTAVYQPRPTYPLIPDGSNATGNVVVELTTDETGAVRHARILKSGGGAFDWSALATVGLWRYAPGRWTGTVVLNFVLKSDKDSKPK